MRRPPAVACGRECPRSEIADDGDAGAQRVIGVRNVAEIAVRGANVRLPGRRSDSPLTRGDSGSIGPRGSVIGWDVFTRLQSEMRSCAFPCMSCSPNDCTSRGIAGIGSEVENVRTKAVPACCSAWRGKVPGTLSCATERMIHRLPGVALRENARNEVPNDQAA
jgi:hypothetical protein